LPLTNIYFKIPVLKNKIFAELENRLHEAEFALGQACRLLEKHIKGTWYEIERKLLEVAVTEVSKEKKITCQ